MISQHGKNINSITYKKILAMKSNLYNIYILLFLLFTSCTNNEKQFILSSSGVGELSFETKLADLPPSIKGLYDKIDIEEGENMVDGGYNLCYTFYLGDQKAMSCDRWSQSKSDLSDQSPLSWVVVYGPNIKTETGISVGDSAMKLVGKKVKHFYYTGGAYFVCEGYAYLINKIDPSLNDRIRAMKTRSTVHELTLIESDFRSDATIESINLRSM